MSPFCSVAVSVVPVLTQSPQSRWYLTLKPVGDDGARRQRRRGVGSGEEVSPPSRLGLRGIVSSKRGLGRRSSLYLVNFDAKILLLAR